MWLHESFKDDCWKTATDDSTAFSGWRKHKTKMVGKPYPRANILNVQLLWLSATKRERTWRRKQDKHFCFMYQPKPISAWPSSWSSVQTSNKLSVLTRRSRHFHPSSHREFFSPSLTQADGTTSLRGTPRDLFVHEWFYQTHTVNSTRLVRDSCSPTTCLPRMSIALRSESFAMMALTLHGLLRASS